MKKLFEYAVIVHKYEKNDKGEQVYKDSELILPPTTVMAASEKEVQFIAVRAVPQEHAENPEDVQISVRPF